MTTPVVTDRVRFPSAENTLVGDLYRPVDNPDPGRVVVVTGSWTTVKEQMASRYARRLAAEGITALTFDFTGYGQSEGPVRDVEDPEQKSADIAAATSFASTLEGVAPDRIGALAICASAGYTAVNATRDPHVASLALVAPWLTTPSWSSPTTGVTTVSPPASGRGGPPVPGSTRPARSTTCPQSRPPTSLQRCTDHGTTTSTRPAGPSPSGEGGSRSWPGPAG